MGHKASEVPLMQGLAGQEYFTTGKELKGKNIGGRGLILSLETGVSIECSM